MALKSSNAQTEYDENNVVLQGHQNKQDRLWEIPITYHFRKRKVKVKTDKHARKFLQALNKLVDINYCSYLENNELKNDHIVRCNSSTLNEYVNVIIHKKQMHSNLTDFYMPHASPQSSSLFKRPLKTTISSPSQD